MLGPLQSGVANSLAVKMEPFKFDPDNNHTFTWWIKTFEEVVGQQENSMSETEKTRFLINKVHVYSYEGLTDLPLKPSQLSFEMTKNKLEEFL